MDKFQIIQGDSIEALLTIEGANADEVVGMQFICEALGVTHDLEKTLNQYVWLLRLENEDTKNMRVGVFKYNLVADFIGGWKKTVVYGQDVEVLYKDNIWTEAI